jgi:hypothetical protein
VVACPITIALRRRNTVSHTISDTLFDAKKDATEALLEKLADASTPGYQVEFDPEEAERAGAFIEDALSEEDAMESSVDLLNVETVHG